MNSADPAGSQKNRIRPHALQPMFRRLLVGQIKHISISRQDLAIFTLQSANERGFREAAVASDKNAFSIEIKKNF